MNCTVKTVKSVEDFSWDQYQLYYLIKKDNKPRLFSEKRALAQRKEEVIYYFNKVAAGPQANALLKKRSPSKVFFQGFCINFQNFET